MEDELELLEIALAQSAEAIDRIQRLVERYYGFKIQGESISPNPRATEVVLVGNAPRLL